MSIHIEQHYADRIGWLRAAVLGANDGIVSTTSLLVGVAAASKAEENGYAERFMRTIKEEEVDLSEYCDLNDARQQIGYFIEEVYNHKRIHSALGYLTPVEFELAWRLARTLPGQQAPLLRA